MAGDGGRSAAWGLRYQYLRTLEALLDAVEDPHCGVDAVHVEGLPREGERAPESIDYELADADGEVLLAVQVKARAPGAELGAGEVFKALAPLVRQRDAARYELLVSAGAGVSVRSLMAVLCSGAPAKEIRSAIGEILGSVSAGRQFPVLRDLKDEHIDKLCRARVRFDPRDEEEITGQIRARLRQYRNRASVGLGEQSAGLLIGYLVSEVFRRAAHATDATMQVALFRKLLLADGATVARALGRRDWGVVVGPLPAAPEIRRPDLLAAALDALPLAAEGITVPNCRFTGLSGIGKTSLAAGYIFERADIYDVIFWADGESELTLASSYSQIYRELRGQDAPVPAQPAVLRDAVLTDLSCAAGRWLLVLDNCVDLRATDEWVPRAGGGHVIVTTTDSASPPWASTLVPVTVMAVAQAVELLRRGLDLQPEPNDEQLGLLDRLARELECWPLALKLACAYLYGGYGIDDIPEYLRKMKVASLGNPALVPPRYPRPLVQAIELCVQRIRDDVASPEPTTSLAAAYALIALRISGYVSSKQIPIHLVLSVPAVDPGEDAFRGAGPVELDDSGVPAADVVRRLRSQSLVAVDERLPGGTCADDSCRCGFTIQVNSVIQEVAQDAFDRDPVTRTIIDRLAWHTERWLRAAMDAGAHERALVLAAHGAVIEAHAGRLGWESDFVAYLRGQLALVYARQNKMGEAVLLLRAEIHQFSGRSEDHAQLLTCQASIQLATYLGAILLDDGAAPADMRVDVDDIASLLENAYSFARDSAAEHPDSAASLVADIHGALRSLELNDVDDKRLSLLMTAVEDLAGRLPGTEVSRAKQVSQEIVDCMDKLRDVPRAAELARKQLQWLGDTTTHEGKQLRCHARKMLIEALAMQRELDAALTELDRFITDAQPPSLYVREFEYLMHNVGLSCALLSWTNSPVAAEMLSRLLSDGRAELVQNAFPGHAAARVRLLCGVNALHRRDLDLARDRVAEFRLRHGNPPRESELRQGTPWLRVANVLDDALAIEKDRADGFTRSASTRHEDSGVARYMLLPPHYRLALLRCPPELLPLYAALAITSTCFTQPLGGNSVLACHLLQGTLKHLGLRGKAIAVIAHVEHKAAGAVELVGECGQAPAMRPDGRTDGHAVLWVETLRRLVDPTIMHVQHLHPMTEQNDTSLSGPIVIPLPNPSLLSKPIRGTSYRCKRPPLLIYWEPRPRWTQAITPIPGSVLAASLAYGKLTLAHAILELIQGLRKLEIRSDISQMDAFHPALASLIDERSQLPALPDAPPEAFLRICRPTDAFA